MTPDGEARPEFSCPLCGSTRQAESYECGGRDYFECGECGLIHLSPEHRLDSAAERAFYGTHENDPSDPRYRAFLSRMVDPLVERLAPGMVGLDYGSGPGPTVSVMLEERGFPTSLYDPFFAPDPSPLERRYHFVTLSETAEHFFRPLQEFERLNRLLRPGGLLAVMTEILPADRNFTEWHYWRDPTHVSLFRPWTMEWLAQHFDWSMEAPHRNVRIFRAG